MNYRCTFLDGLEEGVGSANLFPALELSLLDDEEEVTLVTDGDELVALVGGHFLHSINDNVELLLVEGLVEL